MKVIVAKSAGFCWGVRRAVERARRALATSATPVCTDGPLIHNKQMLKQLESEGISECRHPGRLKGGVLVIRAHGIPPARRKMLARLNARLVDATCPDVARIQSRIKKHAAAGCGVIIFGDPGHAEVEGLLGYAGNKGRIVGNPGEVRRLPDMRPVCLVAQSTQVEEDYARIAAAVRARWPDAVVLDTICASTKQRQGELIEIARKADAIVVVGDLHSANTLRLVKLAGKLKPTFHIQTPEQLEAARFRKFKVVGLTAGASTPAFVIEKAGKALRAIRRISAQAGSARA